MGTIPQKPARAVSLEMSKAAERRALIRRIASSEQFSRSTRLREFLLYVTRKSLAEGCTQIHEHEIGERVFGRPSDYDCSQDNIVRVTASELRRRLELYFATTGAREQLLLEIPRGSYMPVFRSRSEKDSTNGIDAGVAPVAEDSWKEFDTQTATHPVTSRTGIPERIAWISLSLLLAAGCSLLTFLLHRSVSAAHPLDHQPALAAFWSQFLRSNPPTQIVLADSAVSLNEELTQQPVTLTTYLDHSFAASSSDPSLSADRREDVARVFTHNLVTYGDVLAAQRILMIDPLSKSFNLTAARFAVAERLSRENVILIGGKKANPWVFLFDGEMNFSLDWRPGQDAPAVTNRRAQQGEQASYVATTTSGGGVGYSVIAFLPSPSDSAKAVILAGTDSDATNAAANFLTSEPQMEHLLKTFHTDRFPYFEVLLRCSELSGTPLRAELIAFRTHPELR